MIFDKNVRRVCAFCQHSSDFDDETVLCIKMGPMPLDDCCRKYKYDPLRRNPPRPAKIAPVLPDDAFKL